MLRQLPARFALALAAFLRALEIARADQKPTQRAQLAGLR